MSECSARDLEFGMFSIRLAGFLRCVLQGLGVLGLRASGF